MQTQQSLIGHNHPPSDPEIMRERMQENNQKALIRAAALVSAADRIPEKIADQDTADKITDLVKQITVCRKALEDGRVNDKAPYLELCRTVDEFFKPQIEALDAAKKRAGKIQTDFLLEQQRKEQERRAELARKEKEEADKKAAEALRLEAEGRKSEAEARLVLAVEHEHDAAFFSEAANQTGIAVASSQGEMTGAKTGLAFVWTGEIIDRNAIDLNSLRPYLSNDILQKAINQFVKNGGRELPGVKIWEKPQARTR